MAQVINKEWFRDWFSSPFYHRLYFERDEKDAEEFIQKLVHFLQPAPGSRVVDVASGRGRHSFILAKMGFDVTGFDLCLGSVEYAKQLVRMDSRTESVPAAVESDHLNFYQHDMRYPFWVNYFDYAFNFFTSFGYFATRREHDDAMRTIATSLKPGGIFVIDYLNTHYVEDHLVHNEKRNIAGTMYEIHRWDDETYFYKKITIHDITLITPEEHTERVAKFSLGDFTDMLSFQNMQVLEVFGDYKLCPYDIRKTPRLIIVAKKKSGLVDGQATNHSGEEKRLYSDGRKTDALT